MADDVSPFQKAVQDAIDASGKTRDALDSELRERFNTSGKPLWDIIRGKSKKPAADRLRVIEDVLKVSPGTLEQIVYPRVRSNHAPTISADGEETVGITALDLSLSMGPGTLIEEFVESEPVQFDISLLRSITRSPFDRLRLVRGIGTSMEPTFRAEDRFLIDTTVREMTRLDGYYWITIDGAHGLKRLRPAGEDRVLVISENPDFENDRLDKRAVRIEGRAIWFARGL
ncbi:S24 family peptidase [Pacificimonas sp. ICDLI1SI03]